ncbi:hypothetical protein IEU95_11570 [Hoyosella rhizosphaerae]|uniref:Uncharacterized protein n=1 Tax=Hoyosella rhizosphaerae TaxID=1755582 RepID=A0A916U9A9_9ACTN|nr:hypothetical protein [Hoyosella rhizosphaerae]MBN4927472.1 hypothetical protein [Hoyosella rhizosphaerae]GGC64174.1 hypothetical protein GCM10011410_15820 [Hoyosella rhizosphaerae]
MRMMKMLAAAGIGIVVGLSVMKYFKSRDEDYEAETWHNLETAYAASRT